MKITAQIDDNLSSQLKKVSEFFSILVVIIGFLVLMGWAFDISILKSPGPEFSTIKTNVGLCFILISASLWLMLTKRSDERAQHVARILAFLAALIGMFTFLQDIFKFNWGIDQMLFSEVPGALNTFSPNRMAVTVSASIFLLSTSLLLMGRETRVGYRLSQIFVFITGFIALVGILGHIYGVSSLYYFPNYTGMAVYAAITLFLAALGLAFAQADKGFMGIITSKYLGGYISLRLIPLAVIIPIFLGWLMLLGYNKGFYGPHYGTSLLVVGTVIILMMVIWLIASSLNQIDLERDMLAQNLKSSEQKFRTVADFTYNWEFWEDPDGNLIYVSPSCERITGYRPEEFMENPELLEEITHPHDLGKLKNHQHDEMKTKHPISFEFRILNRNGEERWIYHTCQPIYEDKVFLGRRASHEDITERKMAEEKLKESEKYNRNLIEVSLDPLVTIGPDGKITDVNTATETITGHPRIELIGTDFSNYFTQPLKAQEGYERVFEEGSVRDYPLKIQNKDGTITPVLYNASTYKNETDEIIGVFAAARDITQLKKTEKELKKHRDTLEITVEKRTDELTKTNKMLEFEIREHENAEKELEKVVEELTRSNKDLEQFAYIASHDLQEPLRSVSGFLQLLSRRYQGKLDEKADNYINIAVGGANRMQIMIEDLLKFSRVTTRGKEFEPTNFEVVFSDVLMDLKAIIEENNATITHDPLPTVMADESQMKQLFQNLIANGIKFHGEEPPHIHVTAEEKNNQWQFSVKDNGIGIDSKYVERIFEVFKRLHTRKKYPGTGIGLAVSRKIVERHGGNIWVDSDPGEGSTFYFTIPKR